MWWEGGERSRRAQKASCAGLPSEQTDKAMSLARLKERPQRKDAYWAECHRRRGSSNHRLCYPRGRVQHHVTADHTGAWGRERMKETEDPHSALGEGGQAVGRQLMKPHTKP